MEKIELTLKNLKLKSNHRISWILAFINITVQTLITFTSATEQYKIPITAILLVLLIFLALARMGKFSFLVQKKYTLMVFLVLSIVWIKWELYWVVVVNAFFYVLYTYSIRKFEVIISADKIIYPSFPQKEIQWNELQNILLKDGILTIDFRNDKLIQNEIENNELDEKKINEFCRIQLSK
jgi:hypothetical protein